MATREPSVNFSVQYSKRISDAIDAAFARKKKAKLVAISAILEWFSEQHPIVQTVALREVDAGMEGYYADALRRMADQLEAGAKIETGDDNGGDKAPDVAGKIEPAKPLRNAARAIEKSKATLRRHPAPDPDKDD